MMTGMRGLLIATLLVSFFGNKIMLSTASASPTSKLTIEISGLKNRSGTLCLSLFSSEKGFPTQSDLALASLCVPAEETSASFQELVPGRYAVAVIHDFNNDGKLNTNFLGIPNEGFGFSRNPRIINRAPSFTDTAFIVSEKITKIQINLKYLF
ncbi:DUF2141 domain-containing protein [Synechococcus sp. PCC 6312]|uniref:DUF2141 domain-containing protein n=1 Tax=Synechococcus sp. (strain ATCC 27167 / PCC 6312) TaxID=195253 RepID=UPI00029EE50B|nr:DUF2141 domain-containing protein [Synechococcus sp. PCC 6312]AFY60286.1 hypothetical protein Syn6312_1095 [Synechococcus sp. PCC 6312]